MKTYEEVKAKYQPELDRIEMEADVELAMHRANVKMRTQELLDSMSAEQANGYVDGWNDCLEYLTKDDDIIASPRKMGRTICVM